MPTVADECVGERGSKAIEPEPRIAHELQMTVGRCTIVLSFSRIEHELRLKLEILAADGSEIPHVGLKRRICGPSPPNPDAASDHGDQPLIARSFMHRSDVAIQAVR